MGSQNNSPRAFDLYQASGYLSLDRVPNFLSDANQRLFPYFKQLLIGIKDGLEEAVVCKNELHKIEGTGFTPQKSELKIPFDENAGQKQRRSFRYFMYELYATLDLLAELITIIMWPDVNCDPPGRAQFAKFYAYVKNDFRKRAGVISPRYPHLEKLVVDLRTALGLSPGKTNEWFPYFKLLRHKILHFRGTPLAATMVPAKASPNTFFTFLPAEWPFDHLFFVEKKGSGRTIVERFDPEKHLLHIDLIEFTDTLFDYVLQVHSIVFRALLETYRTVASFSYAPDLVSQLEKARERPGFHEF